MGVSIYSFFSAMLWFNIFIVVTTVLRRRNMFIIKFGITSLFMIISLTVFRLAFAMEISHFTRVIRSQTFLPAIYSAFGVTVFSMAGIKISLLVLVIALSCVITIYKLVKISIGHHIAMNAYTGFHNIDTSREEAIANNILSEKGKRGFVQIIKSPLISSPMMTGVFQPTIYLPAIQYRSKQLYFILLHEITHYVNKDVLYKVIVEVLCAVLWWNPFVYLLRKDIDSTMELRCDYSITSQLDDYMKREYLRSLLEACTTSRAVNSGMSLAFVGSDANTIVQRFEVIKGYKKRSRDYGAAFTGMLLVMMSLFIFSFSFVFQPDFEPPMELPNKLSVPKYAEPYGDDEDTYILYFDDGFCSTVDINILKQNYSDVPIIKGDLIDAKN